MSDEEKSELEANPEFNQWLEDNYSVAIEQYKYPSSKVLYTMSADDYLKALERFNSDPKIEPSRIEDNFPTPIAYYFYQANNNYQNDHHRLDLLKSCWESIIFFIYGLVIGEARHRKIDLLSIGITKYDKLLSNKLFNKITITQNILDYTTKKGIEFGCSEIIPVETLSLILKLNQERNGFEHASAKTSTQQKELFQVLYPQLELVLKQLVKLEEVSVFRYHEAISQLFPRCEMFNGYSLDGWKDNITLRKENYFEIVDYFDAKAIFAKIKGVVFCLSPFIHFAQESHETNAVLCFFKQEKGAKYQFEVMGKSQDIYFEKSTFSLMETELNSLISEKPS